MSKVEVVLLTYKPNEKLKTLVKRLKAQTIAPSRILIMNTMVNENEYNVVDEIRNYESITVVDISKDEFDHGGTRDRAMNLCSADYVLFMTQDAIPKNRLLIENLLNTFDEGIAAVYAKQEPDKRCNVIERYTRGFNYSEESYSALEKAAQTNNSIKSIFLSDVCAMYDRKLYEEIGGFPLRAIFNEDMVYCAKALKSDKDVIYQPDAKVIHSHNYTGIEYFKRYFDLGVSHIEFKYIFKDYHAEDEGIKLVIETAKYLQRRREYIMLIPLVYYSACKFIGFRLGKLYKRLPHKLVMKCTMNKEYFM